MKHVFFYKNELLQECVTKLEQHLGKNMANLSLYNSANGAGV